MKIALLPRINVSYLGAESPNLSRNASQFLWVMTVIVILFVSIFKQELFPPQYFLDQSYILSIMGSIDGLVVHDSYASTTYFYQLLGIQNLYVLAAIESMILCISFYISLSKFTFCRFTEYLVISAVSIISAVYLTQYTKDFIVLLLVILFMFMARSRTGLIGWLALVVLYSYYFRFYWLLIGGYFVGLILLRHIRRKAVFITIGAITALLVLAFLFPVVMSVSMGSFRAMMNEGRVGTAAAVTAITPWISGNPVFEWLNTVITVGSLLIPWPVALLGGGLYLAIFVVFSTFFSMGIVSFWNNFQKPDPYVGNIFNLIVSMIFVQAIFVADYGMFLNHITPFAPLFFYIILYHRNRYEYFAKRVGRRSHESRHQLDSQLS